MIRLTEEGSRKFFGDLEDDPDQIFLFSVSGNPSVGGKYISPESPFTIDVSGGDYRAVDSDPDNYDGLIPRTVRTLDFPASSELNGWSSYNLGVATINNSHYQYTGFFRVVYYVVKGSVYPSFRLRVVTPDEEKAIASLNALREAQGMNATGGYQQSSDEFFFQRYF